MDVFPDFGGPSGIGELCEVARALFMFVLVVAVLMLIVFGIIWAISASTGNYATSTKGHTGVLVSLGAAFLSGGGVRWMN
ncbi:DUF6112 family protein [Brevibacterium sp. FAM 25378]|uniref:DUF6112 family protein n=1 Tax=unclassified Brevibacterium TaxID=2614124 RepID=UPI0010925184|nr:DUF6112 family protein [Brevibacterium sp. S22]TGD27614.1 hypothetical protein EB835_18485 [Brevibacterium sp. S22]